MVRALAAVNLAAIERNCRRLRRQLREGTGLAVGGKADGYGHGALPVGPAAPAGRAGRAAGAARAAGASWLAVATAEEAAGLRRAGLDARLLVMGALSPEELAVAVDAGADVVAWHEETAARIAALAASRPEPVGVHVKLDS